MEAFVGLKVIRDSVTDPWELAKAVGAAEEINDDALRYNIGQLPADWISDADKAHLLHFLADRRDVLGQILHDAACFPNLRMVGV
jgi:hypothetical protein